MLKENGVLCSLKLFIVHFQNNTIIEIKIVY
jgi:hypothetical protein